VSAISFGVSGVARLRREKSCGRESRHLVMVTRMTMRSAQDACTAGDGAAVAAAFTDDGARIRR